MPKIIYNCTLDLSNPNNNISPKYPLVQGTDVEFHLNILDNNEPIDLSDEFNYEEIQTTIKPYIISYCKLDNAPVVMKTTDQTLEINYDDTVEDHKYIIKGSALANTAGKNALVLKYDNDFVTYSTQLFYYVEFNPISQLPELIIE